MSWAGVSSNQEKMEIVDSREDADLEEEEKERRGRRGRWRRWRRRKMMSVGRAR